MLIQKEEFQNQSNENNQDNEINREEINNNLDELNSNTNQNQNPRRNARGFDIFLSHGLSAEEVRALRAIFHFTQAQQSLVSGIPLDWTNNGIYQREERWLINQLNNMVNRNLNLNEEENNDFITLNVNDNSLFMGRNSFSIFFDNDVDLRFAFLVGFLVGMLTNIFGIFLLFCRFRATFKLGVVFGMIISILFFSKMMHLK